MSFVDWHRPALRRTLSVDRVLLALPAGLLAVAVLDPPQAMPSAVFTLEALLHIAPFLLVSVAFAAGARATGLDRQIARAFASHSPAAAVAIAAAFGALSPFCSCGVVPIIAGLLAAGVPLAPVMAFWLASPLMDPEMFILMLPVFGPEFTFAKVASAFAIGVFGGVLAHLLTRRIGLDGILKAPATGCGSSCASGPTLEAAPVAWRFWTQPDRRAAFADTARTSALFLGKWLALAFFLESLMIAYVPAEQVGQALGTASWWAIPAAVAAGVPAYLNGYAAIPTVSGLIDLGMAPAAGLGFMLAGGVTSVPAAMAVYPLVRPRVFALYLAAGWAGALLAAYAYAL